MKDERNITYYEINQCLEGYIFSNIPESVTILMYKKGEPGTILPTGFWTIKLNFCYFLCRCVIIQLFKRPKDTINYLDNMTNYTNRKRNIYIKRRII